MDEDLIVADPQILDGKPRVRGTRLSVEFLLERPPVAPQCEQILARYPQLTSEGFSAAFCYAAKSPRGNRTWDLRIAA